MTRFLRSLLRSLGFLTRFPVDKKYYEEACNRGSDARLYPLVGALIGCVGAIIFVLLAQSGFSALVSSLFAVGTIIIITGGLHEDGVSDVADGFFAPKAHDAPARLAIMKDSHIGVFGMLALILIIGLRVALLADIADKGGLLFVAVMLIMSESASRTGMVILWPSLPNVSTNSIASSIGAPNWRDALLAFLIGIFIMLALSFIVANFMLPPSVIILLGATVFLFRLLSRHKIGGLSGDVLGAAQQLGVITTLAAANMVF